MQSIAVLTHFINNKTKFKHTKIIKIFTDSLTSILLIMRYAYTQIIPELAPNRVYQTTL